MRLKKLFIILILSLVLLPLTPVMAEQHTVSSISDQLMCQCGCSLVLSACDCVSPNGAAVMTALIEEQLAQGKSQQEIMAFFIVQYGEQVLVPPLMPTTTPPPPTPTATPPPEQDSNLVLWISSLIGILAVGVVIYLTQKKRVRGK